MCGVWVCKEYPGTDGERGGCEWWEASKKRRDSFRELTRVDEAGIGVVEVCFGKFREGGRVGVG